MTRSLSLGHAFWAMILDIFSLVVKIGKTICSGTNRNLFFLVQVCASNFVFSSYSTNSQKIVFENKIQNKSNFLKKEKAASFFFANEYPFLIDMGAAALMED
jgi:bacteriorhodopsin